MGNDRAIESLIPKEDAVTWEIKHLVLPVS